MKVLVNTAAGVGYLDLLRRQQAVKILLDPSG